MVSAIASSSSHTTSVQYVRAQSQSQEEKSEINPGADEAAAKIAASAQTNWQAKSDSVNIVA